MHLASASPHICRLNFLSRLNYEDGSCNIFLEMGKNSKFWVRVRFGSSMIRVRFYLGSEYFKKLGSYSVRVP